MDGLHACTIATVMIIIFIHSVLIGVTFAVQCRVQWHQGKPYPCAGRWWCPSVWLPSLPEHDSTWTAAPISSRLSRLLRSLTELGKSRAAGTGLPQCRFSSDIILFYLLLFVVSELLFLSFLFLFLFMKIMLFLGHVITHSTGWSKKLLATESQRAKNFTR